MNEQQMLDKEIDVQRSIWREQFNERQRKLIENCRTYTMNDPAGLPGHNIMLIVAQMARLLDQIYISTYFSTKKGE